jgi:hypothetical protein
MVEQDGKVGEDARQFVEQLSYKQHGWGASPMVAIIYKKYLSMSIAIQSIASAYPPRKLCEDLLHGRRDDRDELRLAQSACRFGSHQIGTGAELRHRRLCPPAGASDRRKA